MSARQKGRACRQLRAYVPPGSFCPGTLGLTRTHIRSNLTQHGREREKGVLPARRIAIDTVFTSGSSWYGTPTNASSYPGHLCTLVSPAGGVPPACSRAAAMWAQSGCKRLRASIQRRRQCADEARSADSHQKWTVIDDRNQHTHRLNGEADGRGYVLVHLRQDFFSPQI